jgi:hypothetical protein
MKAQMTKNFLNSLSLNTKNEILVNIANHYGINTQQAYDEVTDEDAEDLIDYVTGETRKLVSLLIQKFKA